MAEIEELNTTSSQPSRKPKIKTARVVPETTPTPSKWKFPKYYITIALVIALFAALWPWVFQPFCVAAYNAFWRYQHKVLQGNFFTKKDFENTMWQLWEQYKAASSRGFFSMMLPFVSLSTVIIAFAMFYKIWKSRPVKVDPSQEEKNYMEALNEYARLQKRLTKMQHILKNLLETDNGDRNASADKATDALKRVAKEAREGIDAIKNNLERHSKSMDDLEQLLSGLNQALQVVSQGRALAKAQPGFEMESDDEAVDHPLEEHKDSDTEPESVEEGSVSEVPSEGTVSTDEGIEAEHNSDNV